MRSISLIFLLAIVFSTTAMAKPIPQGIIVNPTETTLTVSVLPEKEHYVAGERLSLKLHLSEAAYIYLYHINTQGQVQLLFPNALDADNLIEPGTHTFPGTRYSFLVDGKPGTDTIQVIASLEPFDLTVLGQTPSTIQQPFATLSGDPVTLAAHIQSLIIETVDEARWATGWTQFQITMPTQVRDHTDFLEVSLQQPETEETETPSTHFKTDEYTDIHFQRGPIGGSLSANLGGHPNAMSTFGFEFGMDTFRLGLSIADTMDQVPDFFDVGTPVDLGPELVLNEESEVEVYLKLSLGTGLEGLAVELGAGMVIQAQAHLAASVLGSAQPLDVSVLPNGYRTDIFQGAGIIGLSYRAGSLLLQLGFDTHRGIVGGLGMAFEVS